MKGHTNGRAPRIVLAGAVNSSRLTFEALQRHQASLVGVLGLVCSAVPLYEVGYSGTCGTAGHHCRQHKDYA